MLNKHDITASRIAKKQRARYIPGPGPDINSSRRAIAVETKRTIPDGVRHLRGFRKPVYIAGVDAAATKKALEAVGGTTVGVMNSRGEVLKRSTRRRG